MPVPRMEPGTSLRPSGLVALPVDLAGLTELRVHGVGGTTPMTLLADLAPQQVAGDAVAGFYRTSDATGRHIEAYSWGGLTSRSATRVLWLLLLPFLLANLAGWMASPRPAGEEPPVSAVTRWCVRLTALATTVNVLVLACMTAMDVLAYQCGGQPTCAGRRWWLAPLTWEPLVGHPARLAALGAAVPLLVIVVFAGLSTASRRRYERVRPPWAGAAAPPRPQASAAALPGGLEHPDFWSGAVAHARLSRLHLTAALAVVTLVLTHCARTTAQAAGGTTWSWLWVVLLTTGAVLLVVVVVLLAAEAERGRLTTWLLAVAAAAFCAAAAYAWLQPPGPLPTGHLPGMRSSTNVAFAAILLALVPLLVVTARAQWLAAGVTPVAARFRWGAPFVLTALAVVMVNIVLLSILVVTAFALGDLRWCTEGCAVAVATTGTTPVVYVFSIVQVAVTWLTLAPLAALGAFLLVELVRWRRAGHDPAAVEAVQEEYRAQEAAEPLPPPPRRAWWLSALSGFAPASAWTRSVARSRWLATMTTDVSWLLTGLVVVAVVVVIVYQVSIWLLGIPVPAGATTLGVVVAAAVPVAIVVLMRSAWRRLDQRRLVGIIWDVGTFWPRSYHPFAPPSYTERAVPRAAAPGVVAA